MSDGMEELKRENAILRMRVHAAETAMYSIEETLRENLLKNFIQPVVRQMHDLDKRFPIEGSHNEDGVKKIALDAIRASRPELANMSDDNVLKMVFGNADSTNTTSIPPTGPAR